MADDVRQDSRVQLMAVTLGLLVCLPAAVLTGHPGWAAAALVNAVVLALLVHRARPRRRA